MGAGNGWLVDADFEHARPFKTITSMSFQLGRSLGLGMDVGFAFGLSGAMLFVGVFFVLTTHSPTRFIIIISNHSIPFRFYVVGVGQSVCSWEG